MSDRMDNVMSQEERYAIYRKPAPAVDTYEGILRMTAQRIEFKECIKVAGIVGDENGLVH